MDNSLWLGGFGEHSIPDWPCSVCKRGTLKLRVGSLAFEETIESKKIHGEEYWEPNHIEYVFHAWADCRDDRCRQSYSISGIGTVIEFDDEEIGTKEFDEVFTPITIIPTLEIIKVPPRCPENIAKPLSTASSLYWISPESSANQIRIALETLLSHVKILPQDGINESKQCETNLHKRIERFSKENPTLGERMMALKWLGNAGSHGDSIPSADILTALGLMESILDELIDRRSDQCSAQVKQLNQSYSPSKG